MIKSLVLALLLFFHDEEAPSWPAHVACAVRGTVSITFQKADLYYWPDSCTITYQVWEGQLWVWATQKEDEMGPKFEGVLWHEFVSIPLPEDPRLYEGGDFVVEYEFERSIARVGFEWVKVQRGREYRP